MERQERQTEMGENNRESKQQGWRERLGQRDRYPDQSQMLTRRMRERQKDRKSARQGKGQGEGDGELDK